MPNVCVYINEGYMRREIKGEEKKNGIYTDVLRSFLTNYVYDHDKRSGDTYIRPILKLSKKGGDKKKYYFC